MIDARQRLRLPSGESKTYYSLPQFETPGTASLSRLPVNLRTCRICSNSCSLTSRKPQGRFEETHDYLVETGPVP